MSRNSERLPSVKQGDEINVEISDVAYGGDSVSKYNGFTIFIPYGVPFSKYKIKINEVKKDFARGKILKVIQLSDIYNNPACKFFSICGGCDWMNIDYKKQIDFKYKILKHMLKNIAKIDIKPENFITYSTPFYYRNRVQYKLLKERQEIKLGFFKARSHEVAGVDKCVILRTELNELAEKITENLNDFKNGIDIYDEEKNNGYLRHICLRINNKGEILLTFVVALKEIRNYLLKISDKLKEHKSIKGITVNFNLEKGNKIFGEKEKTIYGIPHITEKIRNIEFQLDSSTFFQVNTFMLGKMIEFIEKHTMSGKKIFDLYGGIGALTLPLHKKYSEIIVVEVEKNATDKLKETIKVNNLKNVRVINAKVESIVEKIIKEQRIEQIVLDPPRKGLHPKIPAILRKSDIRKIIYISCNPASFSRDIFQLKQYYNIKKIVPLDMFAQTYHIELMAALEKI